MASISLCLPTALNFSGDNYEFWAAKMQRFLIASDLWDIVDKGFQAPVVDTQLTEEQQKMSKENSSKDAKALFILQSAVSDKIFPSIKDATTANQAWAILQQENSSINKKEGTDWMDSMRAMQYHSGENPDISGMSIVPEKLRKENENSYEPKVMSIGPRFRGARRDLLKMEKTKWECMSSLLDRVQGNAKSDLAKCGELILGLEKEVRESYVDGLEQMKWGDIANIMLYDACFIIEILAGGWFFWDKYSSSPGEDRDNVLSDLMVLDNQIPFLILRKLYCQLLDETDDYRNCGAKSLWLQYYARETSLYRHQKTVALNLFGTQIPIGLWHDLTGSPREALRDLHNFLKRGYNYAVSLITILSLLQTIYTVLSYYHANK